ncbi:MAG: phospholipase D family protein, partial [Cyanobacteria bacterium]|nr:phospholipase D family protein [Cyanobacteriota bacterium]
EANLLIKSKTIAQAFLKQFQYDWTKRSTPMQWAKGIASNIPETVRESILVKTGNPGLLAAFSRELAQNNGATNNNVVPIRPGVPTELNEQTKTLKTGEETT